MTDEGSNSALGSTAFLVLCEIRERTAPVSTSIGRLTPLTLTCTLIGLGPAAFIVKSGSCSVVVVSALLVLSRGFLPFGLLRFAFSESAHGTNVTCFSAIIACGLPIVTLLFIVIATAASVTWLLLLNLLSRLLWCHLENCRGCILEFF